MKTTKTIYECDGLTTSDKSIIEQFSNITGKPYVKLDIEQENLMELFYNDDKSYVIGLNANVGKDVRGNRMPMFTIEEYSTTFTALTESLNAINELCKSEFSGVRDYYLKLYRTTVSAINKLRQSATLLPKQ
jgi:hypothetical protein